MTCDLVALTRRQPDVFAVADGMIAMGEPLELRGGDPEPTQLFDAEHRLLVSIEDPVLVSVPTEVGRLLGADVAARVAAPVWWVEVRASGDVPDATRVARRFADDLVRWAGGIVYPDNLTESPALSWRAGAPQHAGHQQGAGNVIR
ncbi:hypothetical protein BTM25_12460 [Actinomadura rubteroloni]|uniref:Uncharacterized protein n=1 Tax=Actinomadura rubteroloni TaxID=1926885 RepID=A0A2P4UP63_9ACTN|nr:hypothetical protein [Actinomadura rubteroloni]POM26838.1 hypothetical protein BTM25_12460 [Actinomadura rubteroloni]